MPTAPCLPAPPVQFLGLMEPSRAATPFNGAAWAFALATLGYRMLAEFGGGEDGTQHGREARLRSRRGVDATRWFPEVARALSSLDAEHTVVDGDICVLDAAGRSDLQRLRARALHPRRMGGTSAVLLCLRDLLVWQGRDVRGLPWFVRRQLLESLPLAEHSALHLQRVVRAEGVWLHRQAQALGHDAVYAWRKDAPYVAGRSPAWLSIDVDRHSWAQAA